MDIRMSESMALLRIAFGTFQIMGATAMLYLLLKTGVSNLTVWAAAVTAVFTLTSLVLFREPNDLQAEHSCALHGQFVPQSNGRRTLP
jgi:hypothetical protein